MIAVQMRGKPMWLTCSTHPIAYENYFKGVKYNFMFWPQVVGHGWSRSRLGQLNMTNVFYASDYVWKHSFNSFKYNFMFWPQVAGHGWLRSILGPKIVTIEFYAFDLVKKTRKYIYLKYFIKFKFPLYASYASPVTQLWKITKVQFYRWL